MPADRFFAAAPQVRETLQARVAANAQELAVQGAPRKSFYLTGRVGATDIALHSEGSRVVLTRSDGAREEVDLEATGRRVTDTEVPPMPEPVAVTVVGPETVSPSEGEARDEGEPS